MKLRKTPLARAVALASVIAACGAGSEVETEVSNVSALRGELRIEEKVELRLREASALALSGDGKTLFAVGDHHFRIGSYDLARGTVGPNREASVEDAEKSQWEGLALDGKGKLYAMAEDPPRIDVFAKTRPSGARAEAPFATIALTVPRGHELHDFWRDNSNSRCEGILLLKDGHLLVAVEKGTNSDPKQGILEFGPAGDAARGYNPSMLLGADEAFAIPASGKLVGSAYFKIKSGDVRTLEDVSEMQVDATGRIWLLSQESKKLVSLERSLDPSEEKLDLKDVYSLPGRIGFPEGFAFLPDGRLAVADDVPEGEKNLFFLSGLPTLR